jgi:hypothetical protein
MAQLLIERLGLSVAVFIVLITAVKISLIVIRRRVQSGKWRNLQPLSGSGDALTLLYFWSTSCSQCSPQERELEQARVALGSSGLTLIVRKVNALEETELARSMHVLTVPTTVLLDARGNVTAWNAGFAPARKILAQIRASK